MPFEKKKNSGKGCGAASWAATWGALTPHWNTGLIFSHAILDQASWKAIDCNSVSAPAPAIHVEDSNEAQGARLQIGLFLDVVGK